MRPQIEKVITEIEKVIVGKRRETEKVLTAILAQGHILLDDVPGVGKTTLALSLKCAMGLDYRRVQFTPDVLPSDIVGFSVYDKATGDFVYRPGILNGANLLLGDEINCASSKTQSALLEAMEEQNVTVDGVSHPLKEPFIVIATQNSVGAVGTQLLPYAQMDRFLMRLPLGYPDYEAQMQMLRSRQNSNPLDTVNQVLTRDELLACQRAVRLVTSKDAILDYITRLTFASRAHEAVEVGISPRGALFLDRTARAHAWLDGRDYVTGADVREVFKDVCAHRVLLKPQTDKTVDEVLGELLANVDSPDRRSLLSSIGKK